MGSRKPKRLRTARDLLEALKRLPEEALDAEVRGDDGVNREYFLQGLEYSTDDDEREVVLWLEDRPPL